MEVVRQARAHLHKEFANQGDGTHTDVSGLLKDFMRGIKHTLKTRARRNSTTGVKGVFRCGTGYRVAASKKGERMSFGVFDTIEEAARMSEQVRDVLSNGTPDEVSAFLQVNQDRLRAKLQRNNTLGVRGVRRTPYGRYEAWAKNYIATFATLEEAAEAARQGRIKLGLEE